ncbi:MAG: Ppx/GppA family phosphatase [Ardenticatenales bacterium]|jgi:exopolyphosphatase/guanosine-5'-triphosphate,3'-diphosphate pyrophosphatase|nr:Ppx/GppA family phosphatase [Ardenticatenales bacterium]
MSFDAHRGAIVGGTAARAEERGSLDPGDAGSSPQVKAFIDIGTNSVRLVLVRITADGSTTELTQRKETVRLGEGEFGTGFLTPDAMARATLVVGTFADMARANGATEIVAIATAATREARNREVFLSGLRDATGLDVRPISGLEEARLIYLGVASGLHLGDRTAVFIDIGGGSTELIVGDQNSYRALDSLRLGAIRLTAQFFRPGDDGPVSAARYAELQDTVRATAVRALQRLAGYGPLDMAVGSSGTAQNVADIAIRLAHNRLRERTDVVTAAQVADVARMLCGLPQAERAKVPGINPARADIIVAGAAILQTLLEELGVNDLTISDRGLREGLILDDLDRHHPGIRAGQTVREQSVLQLGRRCQFDEPHHVHVARLALGLFDSARAGGLHDLPDTAREILAHAAMLHDIGAFLSYSGHERHTYYLVRHAPLLGFDDHEIELLAAVARFHRKGYPSKLRFEYRDLPRAGRRLVRPLAALLRLAESLDRTHTGVVRDARFARRDDGTLALHVTTGGDWSLERWGLDGQLTAFARVFGERPAILARADAGT